MRSLLLLLLLAPSVAHAGAWSCTRSLGATGGVYYGGRTWQLAGQSPWRPTGSPVLAGSCGYALGKLELAGGADLQPFYWMANADGIVFDDFAVGRVGVRTVGSVQVGVDALLGYPNPGVGVTARALVVGKEAPSGPELRLSALWPGPSPQATVLWTFSSKKREAN